MSIANRSLTDLASRCKFCGYVGHVVGYGFGSTWAQCDNCMASTSPAGSSDAAARMWERGEYSHRPLMEARGDG